jgi:hypothetical protein
MTAGAVLLALALAACGRSASREAPSPTKEPPVSTSPALTWRTLETPLGLSFDAPIAAPPSQGVAGGMTYVVLADGPIAIGAWTGGPWSLAHWQGLVTAGGGQLAAPADVTVCGRSAVQQEATSPGDAATGAVVGDDGAIGHVEHRTPARVRGWCGPSRSAALRWSSSGRWPRRPRAAWRAAEERFFASLRCPAATGG